MNDGFYLCVWIKCAKFIELANSSLCCVKKCKNKTKKKRFFTIRFVIFSWKSKNTNSSVILKICRIGSVVFSFSDIWEDVSFDTDELQRKSGETFLEQKYEISSFAIFLKRYVSLFQEKQNAYILGVFKKCNLVAVTSLKVAMLSWGKMLYSMYVIHVRKVPNAEAVASGPVLFFV